MLSPRGDVPRQAGALPSGDMPCVWMSAGLLSFKLCDRQGECETCPLDRALRGLEPVPEEARPPRRRPERRKPTH